MIGSDKKIVPVTLPREDVERIEQLKKPISEFCRDAVHERLRAVEMAKENTIEERFYEDLDPIVSDTTRKVIVHDDPVMETNPDWSKLFAKV